MKKRCHSPSESINLRYVSIVVCVKQFSVPDLRASPSPSSATASNCFLELLTVHQGSECCCCGLSCTPPNIIELPAASQTPCSCRNMFLLHPFSFGKWNWITCWRWGGKEGGGLYFPTCPPWFSSSLGVWCCVLCCLSLSSVQFVVVTAAAVE